MSCGPNDLTYIFITDTSEKVNKEANSTVRRSLLGYRLEINFAECAILSPSVTSYVFQNPKAGQTYSFMLSAVTSSIDKLKERRMKVSFIWNSFHKTFNRNKVPALLYNFTISG